MLSWRVAHSASQDRAHRHKLAPDLRVGHHAEDAASNPTKQYPRTAPPHHIVHTLANSNSHGQAPDSPPHPRPAPSNDQVPALLHPRPATTNAQSPRATPTLPVAATATSYKPFSPSSNDHPTSPHPPQPPASPARRSKHTRGRRTPGGARAGRDRRQREEEDGAEDGVRSAAAHRPHRHELERRVQPPSRTSARPQPPPRTAERCRPPPRSPPSPCPTAIQSRSRPSP